MSIGRIKNTEIEVNSLSANDLANICYEIARSSKKAHSILNKKKIKSRYAKYGKIVGSEERKKYGEEFADKHSGKLLMQAEIDDAVQKGDRKSLESVFKKYNAEEILRLDSNIHISCQRTGAVLNYIIKQNEGKGRINSLINMFAGVKKAAEKGIEERPKRIADERHAKEVSELVDKINEGNQQKIREENERKAREDLRNGIHQAHKMDAFIADLQGKCQEFDAEAMETYGDSDSGRAWSEMQKNPYKKQLNNINGKNEAR